MKGLTKIIIILGLSAMVSLLLAVFLGVPVQRDVTTLNALVKEKKVEHDVLDQQLRAFKTAQSDLAKAARKDDLANAFVIKEDLVISVKELETAALKTQTTHTIRIKEPDPKVKPVLANRIGFSEVNYELSTISVGFGSIVNFVQYLEHLPHFTEFSNIILSSETATSGSLAVRSGRIFGEFKGVFFIKPIATTTTTTTTK